MAYLKDIANKLSGCGGADANTGKLGCPVEFKTPLHMLAMRKGFKVNAATDDFNMAFINLNIQKGNIVPLVGAETFEKMSSEDSMSTNTRGVERLSVLGLPKYKLVFEEGHEFYRELAKLTSFKAFDIMIGDEEGSWKMAIDSDGNYSGFDAGQVLAELTQEKELGGESESKALIVQFLDRDQWDKDYKIFGAEELGWKPEEIQGVNGVELAFNAVPADADVIIDVSAVLNGDRNYLIEGLVQADFIITVAGVVAVISVFAEGTPGNYQLTIPAVTTGQIVTVDLFDSSLNSNIILNSDILYRSEVISETTVV